MRALTLSLLATALPLAGPVAALDLNAVIDDHSARWIEQQIERQNNSVENGSAVAIDASDVNLSVRSGKFDDVDPDIDISGYIKQNVTITSNTVRDNSLIDVSAGAFTFHSFGGAEPSPPEETETPAP